MRSKRYFTKEQEDWLVENFNRFSCYRDMADCFNKSFRETRSFESIREKCNKRFHLKGKPSVTRYGSKRKEQLPIGTIRKSQTSTFIKVREVPEKAILVDTCAHIGFLFKKKYIPITLDLCRRGR